MNPDFAREFRQLKARLDTLERERGEVGAWQDWTPTVTQSGSVTFTTTFARYTVIQNTVTITARLVATSAGTTNNTITIGGLPITSANAQGVIGHIIITDVGVGWYVGALMLSGATSLLGRAHGVSGNIGVTPNFALASGDTIDIVGGYERG